MAQPKNSCNKIMGQPGKQGKLKNGPLDMNGKYAVCFLLRGVKLGIMWPPHKPN